MDAPENYTPDDYESNGGVHNVTTSSPYDYGNSTDSYSYDDVLPTKGDNLVTTTLVIVLSIIITIVNGLVASVILSNRTLRTSPKYIHVLSLTFANLIYSVAVLPLRAELAIRGRWIHACELRVFVDIYDTSFHPAFTWLALSMLNVVILFLICTSLFDKRAHMPYIALALASLPFILTCVGVIPLYRTVLDYLDTPGDVCTYVISLHRTLALLLLTYPLAALLLVMTSFLTTVLVLYRRNISCGWLRPSRGDHLVPRGDPEGERREYICDVIVISLLTFVLTLPVFALQMYIHAISRNLDCAGETECELYVFQIRIVYFIRVSCAFVTPLVWFLGKDFRYSFLQLLTIRKHEY